MDPSSDFRPFDRCPREFLLAELVALSVSSWCTECKHRYGFAVYKESCILSKRIEQLEVDWKKRLF